MGLIDVWNTIGSSKKKTNVCTYRGCRKKTEKKHTLCDTHYKLRGQFIEKYHFTDKGYDCPVSVISTVELEMRLKFIYLYQIKPDERHRNRNRMLYSKIDKGSNLYTDSVHIRLNEDTLKPSYKLRGCSKNRKKKSPAVNKQVQKEVQKKDKFPLIPNKALLSPVIQKKANRKCLKDKVEEKKLRNKSKGKNKSQDFQRTPSKQEIKSGNVRKKRQVNQRHQPVKIGKIANKAGPRH